MIEVAKKMTWAEFREMELDEDDNYIYELINGIIRKRASPSLAHQDISRRLERRLDNYLDNNPIGKYYHAPVDVYLGDKDGVVPDLSFISKSRLFIVENGNYMDGAPDMIVEIISPGNVKRDRVTKKELYQRYAVKEYWLIDSTNQTVEIFRMKDNAYELLAFLEMEGKLTSDLLPGFEMDVNNLFKD